MPDIDLAHELPARFDRAKQPALSQEFPTFERSEAINAFNSAFNLYDRHIQELASNKGVDVIIEKWKKGEDLSPAENDQLRNLDPETKKKLSDYQIVAWGKRLTIDKDKGSYILTFPGENGQIHRLREGCPIDPVFKLLIEEIDKLQQQIQTLPVDQRIPLEGKLNELNKTAFILANSSKEYRRHFANPADVVPGTKEHARVRLEAYSIYQNPLRQTGDHRNDFFAAMDSLQNRWELSLPARTRAATRIAATAAATAGQTAAPTAATPADTEPQVIISPVTAAGTTPSPTATATTGATTPSTTAEATVGTATIPTATETTTPATGTATATEGTPSTTIDPLQRRGWEIHFLSTQETASKDAHEMAREHLNKVLREDEWYKFWKWPKKIWFRLVEGGALQVYKDRLMQAIFRHNTSHLTYEDATKAAAQLNDARAKGKAELEEIVKRFKTGEQALKPGEEIVTSQGELRRYLIDNLLNPIVQGNITTPEQVRERLSEFVKTHLNDPQVERLFGASANDFGDVAEIFATDVLIMGEQMKNNLQAHHQTLADIDNQITIKLGIARAASRTESRDAVDRAVAWAKRRRAQTLASGAKGLGFVQGIILNPLVVGASTGLAVYGGMRALGIAGRIATPLSIFSGGISGGLVAGIRRGYELGVYDRPHLLIQKAYGGRTPTEEEINAQLRAMPGWKGQLLRAPMVARMAGLYRMSDLEKFSYNTAGVSELINGGGQEFDGATRSSIQQLIDRLNQNPSDQEARRNLAKRLSEVHTRLTFSYANKVDIIDWESREKRAEGERRLVEETGRLRAALTDALRRGGVTPDRIDAEIQNLENQFRDQWRSSFTADKSKKDKDFTVYQIREAAGAAAFAGSIGVIAAPFAQEFLALGARAVGVNAGQTILEGAVNRAAGVVGHPEFLAAAPTIDTFQEAYHNGGVLDLDGIHKVFVDRSHNVQILDQSGNPLSHPPMQLTPDGHLTATGQLDPAIEEAFRHGRMGIGTTTTTEDLIRPTDTSIVEKSFNLDGHTLDMKIPQGVLPNGDPWHGEWVKDPTSNAWDLVAWDDKLAAPVKYADGKFVTLFNDAQFDAQGHITNPSAKPGDFIEFKTTTSPTAVWYEDLIKTGKADTPQGYHFELKGNILKITDSGGLEVAHNQLHYNPATQMLEYTAVDTNPIPSKLVKALKDAGFINSEDEIYNKIRVVGIGRGRFTAAELSQIYGSYPPSIFSNVHGIGAENPDLGFVDFYKSGEAEWFFHDFAKAYPMTEIIDGQRVFSFAHFFNSWEHAQLIDPTHVLIKSGNLAGQTFDISGHANPAFFQQYNLIGKDILFDKLNMSVLDVNREDPTFLTDLDKIKDALASGNWYQNLGDHGKWDVMARFNPLSEDDIKLAGDQSAFVKIPGALQDKLLDKNGEPLAWIKFVHNGKIFATIGPTEQFTAPIHIPGGEVTTVNLITPVTDTITAYDITPPLEIPPIVFPFAPRHPLGPMEMFQREIVPPMYYGGESLESLQEWLRQNPQRHNPYRRRTNPDGSVTWLDRDGNPLRRDINRERQVIQNYLNEVRSNNPQLYADLESLATNPNMAPMENECRVSVNIPAWMEGKNIYRVLDQYVNQMDKNGVKLDPKSFEINIVVNRKRGSTPDNTVAEIRRFIADKRARGENYHINYVDTEFDPPLNNVGHVRKVITDLTLLRSLRRTGQANSLYMESEDADLMNVDPKTVINLIETLDSSPQLDAVRGIQDRFPEEMMKNDALFLYRRLWDFTESFLRRKKYRPNNNPNWNFTWHRIITGGWNTGYTAEAIAQIGGYNSTQTQGEDMTIGEKMTMIRGDKMKPELEVIGKVPTRSDSSPRRFIGELITGKGAYGTAFVDDAINNMIKNSTLDELLQRISSLARISDSNKGTFAGMLSGHFQSVKNLTPNVQEGEKLFDSLMFWLGFKKGDYEYKSDGSLEIKNWTNLQTALNDYRARHVTPRQKGQRIRYRTNP